MSVLKRAVQPMVLLCSMMAFVATPARADEAPALKGTGYRAELMRAMGYQGGKVWKLFEAIPEEKLSWRASEETKTLGELFVHIGNSPTFIGSMLGGPKPDFKAIIAQSKELKSKEAIGGALKKGFDKCMELVTSTPDDELEKTVMTPWKMEMSKRAVLGMLLSHMTEHFGQLTAYARVNGIVPPWILEAKKKAAEKKDAK